MFTPIIKNIEEKEYKLAVDALVLLLDEENERVVATAHYMLGYINTCSDYSERNDRQAKRHLRLNLNSNYPHPYGYVLYAKVENDPNVVLNYLKKGIAHFPKDAEILFSLLRLSPDKNGVIGLVKKSGINDIKLISEVISQLISTGQWNEIIPFIVQLEHGSTLSEEEQNYLNLIKAYAYLFADNPDYSKAEQLLEHVICTDIDNIFAYSHYLGLIYAELKCGNLLKAIEFFDRIPISNAITDLDGWPQPLWISISFESLYQIIFKSILAAFTQDAPRKLKAGVLYSLYLYSASEIYDIYRYKKSDVATLTRFLKTNFSKEVAAAAYQMKCHFKQFEEAYDILWEFLKYYQVPEDSEVFFSEISDNATNPEICRIAQKTIEHLQNDEYTSSQFVSSIFTTLVKRLHEIKQYDLNRELAQSLSLSDILSSGCAFECAYAYGEKEQPRATAIYEALVKNEPNNSSAINNLGVHYEHAGELHKALDCYERANFIDPKDEIHQNNLARIRELIYRETEEKVLATSDAISMDALEEIGYTDQFRRKLLSIQDSEMCIILQRDIWECAIAVVAKQDKMATIMSGSIIEALLMLKLKEQGIQEYDISPISKGKKAQNYPVNEMGLNELLYVADQKGILNKNSYHLGHYIRDYRNVVHPAKELRMSEKVSHENVLTMWSILKRLVSDLYS